jgi:hypothetical protein
MKFSPKLEDWRIRQGDYATRTGERCGAFSIPGPAGRQLLVLATDGQSPSGMGWEHVSVSIKGNRPPNWREMCFIKDLFWSADEVVVQFHPRGQDYVNNMSTCLHLWRCTAQEFPTPPPSLIGIKELGTLA